MVCTEQCVKHSMQRPEDCYQSQVQFRSCVRGIQIVFEPSNNFEQILLTFDGLTEVKTLPCGLLPLPQYRSKALDRRGYRLGLISNTTSREAVPQALIEYGIKRYFPVVVLSSTSGHRKPGARIFEIATAALGVDPRRSVYIGDRPSRDVVGAKRAGFAMSVLIDDERVEVKEPLDEFPETDHTIRSLSELLGIL